MRDPHTTTGVDLPPAGGTSEGRATRTGITCRGCGEDVHPFAAGHHAQTCPALRAPAPQPAPAASCPCDGTGTVPAGRLAPSEHGPLPCPADNCTAQPAPAEAAGAVVLAVGCPRCGMGAGERCVPVSTLDPLEIGEAHPRRHAAARTPAAPAREAVRITERACPGGCGESQTLYGGVWSCNECGRTEPDAATVERVRAARPAPAPDDAAEFHRDPDSSQTGSSAPDDAAALVALTKPLRDLRSAAFHGFVNLADEAEAEAVRVFTAALAAARAREGEPLRELYHVACDDRTRLAAKLAETALERDAAIRERDAARAREGAPDTGLVFEFAGWLAHKEGLSASRLGALVARFLSTRQRFNDDTEPSAPAALRPARDAEEVGDG